LTAGYITSSEALTLCNNSEAISEFIYTESGSTSRHSALTWNVTYFAYEFVSGEFEKSAQSFTSSSKAAAIFAPLLTKTEYIFKEFSKTSVHKTSW